MKSDYKGIWVFAEQENGKLHQTVLELLAKSKELQNEIEVQKAANEAQPLMASIMEEMIRRS